MPVAQFMQLKRATLNTKVDGQIPCGFIYNALAILSQDFCIICMLIFYHRQKRLDDSTLQLFSALEVQLEEGLLLVAHQQTTPLYWEHALWRLSTLNYLSLSHVCSTSHNVEQCYVKIIAKHIGNNTESEVEITTRDYPPGDYLVIFNLTDIYGQTAQPRGPLFLTRMFIILF